MDTNTSVTGNLANLVKSTQSAPAQPQLAPVAEGVAADVVQPVLPQPMNKWRVGGVGCLLGLVVGLVVGGYFYYRLYQKHTQLMQQTQEDDDCQVADMGPVSGFGDPSLLLRQQMAQFYNNPPAPPAAATPQVPAAAPTAPAPAPAPSLADPNFTLI